MHPKVAQVLAENRISYVVRTHSDFSEPIHEPADLARALGYELARITKTLLVRSISGPPFGLVVASMGMRVDFPAVAAQIGVKRIEVSSHSELLSVTDYPPNGVSPLGVEGVPVFIDSKLSDFHTILIGGGAVGVEVEISPQDLLTATRAISIPLTA